MNFLGGRSRQAIQDAYDTMTRKEEPVGTLREFGFGPGIKDGESGAAAAAPPTPRSRVVVEEPKTPLSKEEVVDQAIQAGEDAVDDGDEEESKNLTVGVKKTLRRDLLKCFVEGDSEGDVKPWPKIERKLQQYVMEKKKTLRTEEMAFVLAGSLKRLLPRRDEEAAAAAAEQRVAAEAASEAAKDAKDAAAAAAKNVLAAGSNAFVSTASTSSGYGYSAPQSSAAGGGVKRKAEDDLESFEDMAAPPPTPAGSATPLGDLAGGEVAAGSTGAPPAAVGGGGPKETKPFKGFGLGLGGKKGGIKKSNKRKKAGAFAMGGDDDDD